MQSPSSFTMARHCQAGLIEKLALTPTKKLVKKIKALMMILKPSFLKDKYQEGMSDWFPNETRTWLLRGKALKHKAIHFPLNVPGKSFLERIKDTLPAIPIMT